MEVMNVLLTKVVCPRPASDRIQRVYDEIVRYIHECEVEQADRLAGYLPTLDEYLENRLGTSAVFILCGIFEYALAPQS